MAKTELKPCPFCGGTHISVRGETSYFVRCQNCTAEIVYMDSIKSAVKAWNRGTDND